MMIASAVSDSSLIYLNYIPVFSMHGNPGTKACHYRVQKKKKEPNYEHFFLVCLYPRDT